jgi:prepilin peptidase CpaA
MQVQNLLDQVHFDLLIHGARYKLSIEAATVMVLCYIGYTDFRTFKIRNESLILLLGLYAAYALLTRSTFEILSNVLFGIVIFAILLFFYARKLIGGGDVKLLSIACLWVGVHCALLFSIALLAFISLHVAAAGMGWVGTNSIEGRRGIPYAPSIAGAIIAVIMLGCT